ncbi:MAG: hypothetical protein ACJ77O_03990 [Chloroflexota bacterium]
MDPITHLPATRPSASPLERDLAEVDAAIELILSGLATRIRLVGLLRPDGVAPIGLAHAQAAGLAFEVDRGQEGAAVLTVGPRAHRQRVG